MQKQVILKWIEDPCPIDTKDVRIAANFQDFWNVHNFLKSYYLGEIRHEEKSQISSIKCGTKSLSGELIESFEIF